MDSRGRLRGTASGPVLMTRHSLPARGHASRPRRGAPAVKWSGGNNRKPADSQDEATPQSPTDPEPPAGARNLVLVVFDSLRYDSFVAAQPRNAMMLGSLERRWSYASWTAPSHYNLLMGLLPHTSPDHV